MLPKEKCGRLRNIEVRGIQSFGDNGNEVVGRAYRVQGSKHLVAAKNSVHIESIEVTGAKQTRKEESNNSSGSWDATVTS